MVTWWRSSLSGTLPNTGIGFNLWRHHFMLPVSCCLWKYLHLLHYFTRVHRSVCAPSAASDLSHTDCKNDVVHHIISCPVVTSLLTYGSTRAQQSSPRLSALLRAIRWFGEIRLDGYHQLPSVLNVTILTSAWFSELVSKTQNKSGNQIQTCYIQRSAELISGRDPGL